MNKDLLRGAELSVDAELAQMIKESAKSLAKELIDSTNLQSGQILVIGCSSSEILGNKIGKGSSYDAAKILFEAIYPVLRDNGIYLAAQCCEHLNRALIIERECAEKYGYDEVAVVPQPKAGGSFATITFGSLNDAVAVEHVKAKAGIDIGGTLIGMHLSEVAVPVRLSIKKIGEANILCARTRPKYIGGPRAKYE